MKQPKLSASDLYKELRRILLTGDEKALRNFVLEHLDDLPEEIQKTIIFLLFQESLENLFRQEERVINFKEKVLEGLINFERIKTETRDKIKLLELRKKLEDLKKDK